MLDLGKKQRTGRRGDMKNCAREGRDFYGWFSVPPAAATIEVRIQHGVT